MSGVTFAFQIPVVFTSLRLTRVRDGSGGL